MGRRVDTKDFLQLVTADGIRCIAMQAEKGFIQFPAHDLDEAAELAAWIDSKQKNAYFALATFKEVYINEKGKERVKRKRQNVDQLHCLWLDIDYKSCDPATEKGAVTALSEFLKTTAFPPPTAMVSSGNGMHVYWPLSCPVSFAEWLPVAQAFKELCQSSGLPADHACTADASRVLRPVGTHNWKDASNPKAVRFVGGSGNRYDLAVLAERLGNPKRGRGRSRKSDGGDDGSINIPEHLRSAIAGESDSSEYTKGVGYAQNTKSVFKKCGVLKHILKTGGAEQDEPEWSATLTLLAHLDDGAKFVHRMSSGHASYDADATMEKWQQKIEAVEEGTGPTLCSTFAGWHEDLCKACPFYKSSKVKTPKSLAYMDDTPPPSKEKHKGPHLSPVKKFQKGNLPKHYRIGGNNDCIERKIWNAETKEYEWSPVLRHVWEVTKVSRQIQSKDYEIEIRNTHGQNVVEFLVPSMELGSTDLTKTIANYGCPVVNTTELRELKQFVSTWLDELRAQNNIDDVTGQLGWIIDGDDDENQKVIGFATGSTAYYCNGEVRDGVVSASNKFKGIEGSFRPKGQLGPWKDAAKAIVEQGCDHLVLMIATSFAAPLMRFTEQPGAVLSVVSEDSAAGKSTGLRLAQAVWGNPRHAPATMDDTQTVVKNKLAYLQNLPAYWDEVRGDESKMHQFMMLAFQVTQGRDRERANSKAETIRAEEWQTLLTACSNQSLFDLALETDAESNAGVYRIFEVKVEPNEYPTHDHGIMSLIAQLDRNFGHAGMIYAEYLAKNMDTIAEEVEALRVALEKVIDLKGPERFWLAAIAALLLGAKYAGRCGLVDIDVKRLRAYLLNSLHKLRARAVTGRDRLAPRELLALYQQQHQDGKIVVDWFPTVRGGDREPILQGNHSHVRKPMFVHSIEDNLMMVNKLDFKTWLWKSKELKFNDKMQRQFAEEVDMREQKCQMAAGTKFRLSRAMCLIFNLNEIEETTND